MSSADKEKVSEAEANWDLRGQYHMPGQMNLTMESFGMVRETVNEDGIRTVENTFFRRQ